MEKEKGKKKKKKEERDEFRTALQEFGRDQLKLLQAASSTQLGAELHLLAKVRLKVLPVPNALLHVCSCPVCTETVCLLILLSAQSSAQLLKRYVSLKLKTSQTIYVFTPSAETEHKGHDLVSPLSRENVVISKGVLCNTANSFYHDINSPIC